MKHLWKAAWGRLPRRARFGARSVKPSVSLASFASLASLASLTSLACLALAPVARADLAVAPSCSAVPLSADIDRAAAAAALPTFVGLNQICALQALLATTGDLPGSRVVDGRYDRQTRDALKGFQSARGLPDNGLLTPETMETLAGAALDRIYAEEPAPTAAATPAETPALAEAALTEASPTVSAQTALAVASTTADSGADSGPDSGADSGTSAGFDLSGDADLSAEDRQRAVEAFLAETAAQALGASGFTTTDAPETTAAPATATATATATAPAPSSGLPDPLASRAVSDFVELSFCHDPSHARDADILRNQARLPATTCLRVFEGAGNLPYRLYSLEVSDVGPSLLVMHDGHDDAFDAAVATLSRFGGRLIAMQWDETTQTTLLGANPEILGVSPASNSGCDWSDLERPLAFAVHDYIVAAGSPVLILRANTTQLSALDRFSDGENRFVLSDLGPTREGFSPSIEPLADDAFLELMVTSSTRRAADISALVRAGVASGLPVALTLVDALGRRDQCSIEALALQTDQPVMRLLLGKARGERAAALLARAVAATGLEEGLVPVAPQSVAGEIAATAPLTASGSASASASASGAAQAATAPAVAGVAAAREVGDIPAEVLALAAGGLDAAFNDTLNLQTQAPRTEVAALAPGLPPLPLTRPSAEEDVNILAGSLEQSQARVAANRVVTGIAVGTGVDALAPVAVAGEGGFTLSAEVAVEGDGVIVEEAVGPALALPPAPTLRPESDLPHRFIADNTDPIFAMLGEDFYRLQNQGSSSGGVVMGQRILSGTQYYDPNAAPRVISSRTLSSTVTPGYTAPGYTAPGYTAPGLTPGANPATNPGAVPTSPSTPVISGPLYGTAGQASPQQSGQAYGQTNPQPYTSAAPAAETVIINNSLY